MEKLQNIPDHSVFFPSAVRRAVVANLRDYLAIMAYTWPEVLEGDDAVYNRAQDLLNKLEGRI